jgi:hypothetical protein
MDKGSSEPWKRFDQSLFELKLRVPARRMHEKTESRRRQVQFELRKAGRDKGVGFFVALADSDLEVLREFLEKDIDRICREVWRTQGNSISAEFVSVVLFETVFNTIEVRTGSIKWGIDQMAGRMHFADLTPVRSHLAQAINQLKSDMRNRYEIEARELEYGNAPMQETKPKPAFSGTATWRSCGDEFKQLGDEETRIIRATKKERLFADCYFDLSATLERATMLELREGPDEHLRVRFEALATRAGIALGCATNVAPLKFWLFKLFLYLSETKSRHLFAPTSHVRIGDNPQSDLLKPHAGEIVSSPGGIITKVYEASANFCSWLEKQTLETEHRRGGVPPEDVKVKQFSAEAEFGDVLTAIGGRRGWLRQALEQSEPSKHNAATEQRSKRLRATVNSPIAARKMEGHLESRGIGLTDFATTVGTTDRTLRSFRKTGKVRRDIFESIAKQMGTTKEALLKE